MKKIGVSFTMWAFAASVLGAAIGALGLPTYAQQNSNAVIPDSSPGPPSEIRALKVRGNIYMVVGAGANITVQVGDDGVLLVDSGAGAKNANVLAVVRQLSTKPIRYIINTSFRPDHTGGNAGFAGGARGAAPRGGAGGGGRGGRGGTPIIAHESVLARMSAPSGKSAPTPAEAWPTETFYTSYHDLFFNGEGIQIYHEPAAATDGDVIAFFRRTDVISTGDIFQTTTYPFIDVNTGGGINGVIKGLNHILEIAIPEEKQEGGTMIIPGHGRICDEADVLEYRDMLTIIRDRIQDMIKKGKTAREVQAAGITRDYDPRYGSTSGPWTTAMFIEAAYQSLAPKTPKP